MKIKILLSFIFSPLLLVGQVNFTSSNLPIIIINTEDNQEIIDTLEIRAQMGIINNTSGTNHVSDPFNDYEGNISIEIRGSTSQQYPKKSYGFETQTETGENDNVSLLGMPDENDWILYAPYTDKTMLRNILTFHLSQSMGHYASRYQFCELVVNDEYLGVYILFEKIKRDQGRIDIAKLRPEDIEGDELTGGYVIKIDKTTAGGEESWTSNFNDKVFFQYHDPIDHELQPEQKEYIQEYLHNFEAALFGNDFTNPNTGYRPYIDIISFIDFFILQELGRTVDGYRSSSFMHKDKDSNDSRLKAGPMWDFNLSYGNANYCEGFYISGWQYEFNNICSWANPEVPGWWERFLEDPYFTSQLRCRWDSLRQETLSLENITQFVQDHASNIDEAKDRNYEKWPIIGEQINWNAFVGETYEEEIDYLLGWIEDRTTWLDNNIPGTCITVATQELNNNNISIAPNPTRNHLIIESPFNEYQIKIIDINGRHLLSQQSFSQRLELNLPNLVKGTYFIYVQNLVDGQLIIDKVLIQ